MPRARTSSLSRTVRRSGGPKSWGELRFSFDWLNFTFQREPLGWDCYDPGGTCAVSYVEFPATLPMLGVRGSF